MTHRKGFKRRVRDRMAKTGERYAAARHHLETRQTDRDQLEQAHHRMMEGFELDAERALELERHVANNPDDLAARSTLLGHHVMRANEPGVRERRRAHLLWLVDHRPDAPIAGLPPAMLRPDEDPEGHAMLADRWRAAAKRRRDDARVLRHAAVFLGATDPAEAVALLESARALEPGDPDLASDLSRGLSRAGRLADALLEAERALEADADDDDDDELSPELRRFYRLGAAAWAALAAGERDKARTYARELLDLAPRHADDWNHGNALHEGQQVLGHLALEADELEAAREALLASARTPGSPQLDSFGPRFSLARALLERGERADVIEYLKLVGAFWQDERQVRWLEEISRGELPRGFGRS